MRIKGYKSIKMKKGFALIYTVLFLALITATVFSAWKINFSSVKLTRKTDSYIQAYNLALHGIDLGWNQYKNAIGKSNPMTTDISYPPGLVASCNQLTNPNVKRSSSTSIVNLYSSIRFDDIKNGVYDYLFCHDGKPKNIQNIGKVQGVGHYMNEKIVLRGRIKHDDTLTCNYSYETFNGFDIITGSGTCTATYDGSNYQNSCPFDPLIINSQTIGNVTYYPGSGCNEFDHKKDSIDIYQYKP